MKQVTITPTVRSISAWRGGCRAGRKIQYTVEYVSGGDDATTPRTIEIPDDDDPDDYAACVIASEKFASFPEAAAFASTMPGRVRLTLGGLGVAHSTSRAGFPKRGPDVLSDDERSELTGYGFDVAAIAQAEGGE